MHSHDAHRPGQVAGHDLGDLMRIEAAGQLAAHVQQPAQLQGEALGACQQPDRADGRCRPVREDRQEAQVVRAEAVQTELRQRDDADRRAVVAHRHDQHRLVDVLGPGDRRAARVVVRVVEEDRLAVLGDPAREALAEPALEQCHVDVLVGAEASFEGDRDDGVRELDQVDPGIVVIDDPVGLLDDGPGDLLDRDGPAHPGGRGLEHLELGRPGSGLLEQLGVGEGDRGVGRQGRDEGHVAARPGTRILAQRGQRADDPAVVHERSRQVAGDLGDAVVPGVAVLTDGPDVREGQDVTRAQDLADPALVTTEDRQAARDVVGETGPGGDLQAVVAEHPDGRGVGPQPAPRLVDDHPDERLAVVRGGQAPGDPEDRVEALGELRLGAGVGVASGPDRPPLDDLGLGVRAGRPVAADEPPEDRAAAAGTRRRGRRDGHRRPVQDGRFVGSLEARAHVPMVPPRGGLGRPPSVPVPGRTLVPDGVVSLTGS